MLVEIYILVGVLNILGKMNDYNIPNTPELRDLRVRRGANDFTPYVASDKAQDLKYDVRGILNGEYYKERAKRSYPGQQTGYVNQANTSWGNYNGNNNGYYNGNPGNTPGSNGYNAGGNYLAGGYYRYPNGTYPGYNQYASYPAYTPYPITYTGYKQNPGNQYPGYNSANYNTNTYTPFNKAGYNSITGPTTPGPMSTTTQIKISCIVCDIRCPQFMKRFGLFCVKDDSDYD